jgi:glutamate-1-semialdehyde 2,1-aminomutase
MDLIGDGRYEQVGTFNGNPLAMSAARATLTEIMTDEAYAHIAHLRELITHGVQTIIDRHALPWHVTTAGAKGCITFLPEPIRNLRDFYLIDDRYGQAHWLFQHNGGVFLPPWGKIEQWLISVQHNDEDVERFVANFERFAEALVRRREHAAAD